MWTLTPPNHSVPLGKEALQDARETSRHDYWELGVSDTFSSTLRELHERPHNSKRVQAYRESRMSPPSVVTWMRMTDSD